MSKRSAAVALAALVTMLMAQSVAVADQGAAIDLGSIHINEPLARGDSYRLPEMEVINPGTVVTRYRMSARPVTGLSGSVMPAAWFAFTPEEFSLSPGGSETVSIELNIPADAEFGVYSGLLGPSVVPEGDGVSAAAAVAAKVTFEVPSPAAVWTSQAGDFLAHSGPLVYAIVGLLLVTAAVATVRRRFTFRIERR